MPPNPPIPCTAASGKAATPQRHEHSQEPAEFIVPLPVVRPVAPVAVAGATMVVAAELAAEVAGGGGVAAADELPSAMAAAVPVPFWLMAICWNMAWVLLAVGLMEKVIPLPQ